jgi:hypothetical protein
MNMTRFLITTAIAAGLMMSAASAETDSRLSSVGDMAAFALACPSYWDRLPPRTQRIIVGIGEDVAKGYDKETMRKAALESYAKGYDKEGERWCASMAAVYDKAGQF